MPRPPPALPTFGVPYQAASVSGTRGVRCHAYVGFGVGIYWGVGGISPVLPMVKPLNIVVK